MRLGNTTAQHGRKRECIAACADQKRVMSFETLRHINRRTNGFSQVAIGGVTHIAHNLHRNGNVLAFADAHPSAYRALPVEVRSGKCLVDDTCARYGILARVQTRRNVARPKIAVAGLNPHAGEHGVIGDEELRTFAPAIAKAVVEGIDVSGPYPADTLFVRAVRGEFDVVIAAYHDQGLVPVKLVAFGHAVNVTLGLPIVRTSVDHGTAFDIARKGTADEGSLVEAILLAVKLATSDGARGRRPPSS